MTEGYTPTPQERQRAKNSPDKLKVSGDQTFATLQGEGQSIGKPAVFLRLHNCNLECTWCDTKYTWDKTSQDYWTEGEDWTYEQTIAELSKYGNIKRLVITGGEPMLQQKKIAKLVGMMPEWTIEVETNGTVAPTPELAERCQFNVSPKLANSGNTRRARFRPDVLKRFNALPLTTFKFVATEPEDLDEVEEIVQSCQLDPEKIIIMPEGTTQADITSHAAALAEHVKNKGWRLVPRLQVMLWGSQRKM